MSLNGQEKEYTDKVLKAPRPPMPKPPRKISFINLIEADDDPDSDSESNQNNNISIKNQIAVKDKKTCNVFEDDRYEDSYDEEFGECETNPDSGKLKI